MKKIIAGMLSLMIITAFCGCQQKTASGEICVYMLTQNEKFENVIKSFEQSNPDVNITFDYGILDYYTTPSEAKKKLNTKLMGGEGPDIIIMDDLDIEKYIETGRLAEFTSIVKDTDGIPKNILKEFETDEDIYAIPVSISFISNTVRDGADVDFSSLESFLNSVKEQNLNAQAISFDNASAIWYRTCIEPDIQDSGSISKEKITAFYQSLKELMTLYGDETEYASYQQLNMQVNPLAQQFVMEEENIDATRDYICSMMDLQGLYSLRAEGKLNFTFAEWNKGTAYIPQCVAAINANSKNKDGAEALIKYLLSHDGQSKVCREDLIPVNTDEIQAMMDKDEEYSIVGGCEINPFSETDKKDVISLIEKLQKPLKSDANIMEIIMTGAQDYLNEEISLDNAVDQTSEKIKLYLSE